MDKFEGLVEDEVPHPDISGEMTGIDFNSEQMMPGSEFKDKKAMQNEKQRLQKMIILKR